MIFLLEDKNIEYIYEGEVYIDIDHKTSNYSINIILGGSKEILPTLDIFKGKLYIYLEEGHHYLVINLENSYIKYIEIEDKIYFKINCNMTFLKISEDD